MNKSYNSPLGQLVQNQNHIGVKVGTSTKQNQKSTIARQNHAKYADMISKLKSELMGKWIITIVVLMAGLRAIVNVAKFMSFGWTMCLSLALVAKIITTILLTTIACEEDKKLNKL